MRTIKEIYETHTSKPVTIQNESYDLVEWELQSDKEQVALWRHLKSLGVHPMDIYQFNYWGKDGKFHRTTHIYN
jgi:hypothetical protein